MKNVDAKYQAEVGYWAFYNHVQDYKDIWDGDQNVYIEVFEQLVTTSLRQSMANTPNKQKF